MVVVWSLLAVQPILLVRACGGALSGCFRSARKRIGARSGPRARHARAARRPWRRRRGLKRRAERSRRAASRFARARRAGRERERERESLIVASPSHGPLAPLHTRYYHVPDTIPMHPFSAEHLRGVSHVDRVLSSSRRWPRARRQWIDPLPAPMTPSPRAKAKKDAATNGK